MDASFSSVAAFLVKHILGHYVFAWMGKGFLREIAEDWLRKGSAKRRSRNPRRGMAILAMNITGRMPVPRRV